MHAAPCAVISIVCLEIVPSQPILNAKCDHRHSMSLWGHRLGACKGTCSRDVLRTTFANGVHMARAAIRDPLRPEKNLAVHRSHLQLDTKLTRHGTSTALKHRPVRVIKTPTAPMGGTSTTQ